MTNTIEQKKDDAAPATNIKPEHVLALEAFRAGQGEFGLFSCFVNGEPAAAFCYADTDPETGLSRLQPLFVSVTPNMDLRDHEGVAPTKEPPSNLLN
jgi:hypothetical protein